MADGAWERHFNTHYYEGDWSGIALRSTGGLLSLYPDPAATASYSDTAHLGACPRVRAALGVFGCRLQSVRFLRLGPDAKILEHRDHGIGFNAGIGFDAGEVRLHVPLETSDEVEFVLDGALLAMSAGECWYVDVSRPHRVFNSGAEPRVHLVIDCVVNAWLMDVFEEAMVPDSAAAPEAAAGPGLQAELLPRAQAEPSPSPASFERFRGLVAGDAGLAEALWAVRDYEKFVELSVTLGAERGLAFAPDDVRRAIADGERRWLDANG